MNPGILVAAICLLVLAVAHSALGELLIIGPMSAATSLPARLPVRVTQRVLRFAWHLTSLAWVTLAWLILAQPLTSGPIALLLLLSGLITHGFSRGAHPAWAVFFIGAMGAVQATFGHVGAPAVALVGASLLTLISALHVGWAFGLKFGISSAIPETSRAPSRALTMLVAFGLAGMAVVLLSLGNWLAPLPWVRSLGIACSVIFALRTVGDFRRVGLFKRRTPTPFDRLDTLLYTPLSFLLTASFIWQL